MNQSKVSRTKKILFVSPFHPLHLLLPLLAQLSTIIMFCELSPRDDKFLCFKWANTWYIKQLGLLSLQSPNDDLPPPWWPSLSLSLSHNKLHALSSLDNWSSDIVKSVLNLK